MRVGYHGRPNVATTVSVISAHWKRRIPWGCRRGRCCKRKGLRYQLASEWYTVHVKTCPSAHGGVQAADLWAARHCLGLPTLQRLLQPSPQGLLPLQGLLQPSPQGLSPQPRLLQPSPQGLSPLQGLLQPSPQGLSPQPRLLQP